MFEWMSKEHLIIANIAAIISILTIFYYLFRFFKNYRFKSHEIKNINDLFAIAYLLLCADKINETGLWGRTIGKYLNLHYPFEKEVLKKLNNYKKNGSITHTVHALNAFYIIKKTVNYYSALNLEKVEKYLREIRHNSGLFYPAASEVVNVDECDNLAHELRHNSAALVTIYYLLKFKKDYKETDLNEYKEWINDSLDFILKLPPDKLWLCDPKYCHSLAYLLTSFNYMRSLKEVNVKYQDPLKMLIQDGISALLSRLNNNYWMYKEHNDTKCFYTLLILETLLEIPEFYNNSKYLKISFNIIQTLLEFRNSDKGLSFGGTIKNSKYSISDVGITSKLIVVINKIEEKNTNLKIIKDNQIKKLTIIKNEAKSYIIKNLLCVRTGAYNMITHSYVSMIQLLEIFTEWEKEELLKKYILVDEFINYWRRNEKESLHKILRINLPEVKYIRTLLKRDMLNKHSKFLARLGLLTYWG